MPTAEAIEIDVDGYPVRISNPDRVYFSARGETKLDLANYYLSVGDGIVRALYERPCMLHRFPKGVDDKKVHQKRIPSGAPEWIETVRSPVPVAPERTPLALVWTSGVSNGVAAV